MNSTMNGRDLNRGCNVVRRELKSVRLAAELIDQLKTLAALQGTSLTTLVEKAMRNTLRRGAKRLHKTLSAKLLKSVALLEHLRLVESSKADAQVAPALTLEDCAP